MKRELKKLLKDISTVQDVNIVNEKMIDNPDRDMFNIVLECYSNLAHTYLAAFSLEVASPVSQYLMEYKEYLAKYNKEKEDKRKVIIDNMSRVANIAHLENGYYELKLLYVMVPDKVIDIYKISSIDNTLLEFDERVKDYQYYNTTLKDTLRIKKEVYEGRGLNEVVATSEKDGGQSLFVKEQSVIIPMLHKTGKYKIDGYNYYGVYNDAHGMKITQGDNFSFKLTRQGKSRTYYMKIDSYKEGREDKEKLTIKHFGEDTNPFFLLTQNNQVLHDYRWQDIIPPTKNESFNVALENTFREALILENRLFKEVDLPLEERTFKPPKRLSHDEYYTFRKDFLDYINVYANVLDGDLVPDEHGKDKEFIHLANLEDSIYASINNDRKKILAKGLSPSDLVNRVNVNGQAIISTIKQGYNTSSSKQTQMYESNTTAPNPIDIYKLFQYIKISHHTKTKNSKKMGNTDAPIHAQLVRKANMEYLGTFAPKNSSNMESNVLLHFNTRDENIIERGVKHRDIFKPTSELK